MEVVLIGADNSAKAMAKYMDKAKMKFPAVNFDDLGSVDVVTNYSKGVIPQLIAINSKGEVLVDSFSGDDYIGADYVLNALKEWSKSGGTFTVSSK